MGNLRAGVSKMEITPPVGTDLSGYIRRFGSSTGIHDPLWANILWVANGNDQVLFISMDVMNFSEEFSERAKAALAEETNIAKDNILLAAIHTHSAPGIHIFRDGSKRDTKWEDRVLHVLVNGSKEATQRPKKALFATGTGQASIGYNRRKPGGAVDPSLTLAGLFTENEELFSLIANYGCHPVVLAEDNLHISADYVGYFRDQLGKLFAPDITTLFFTGATGDVDPIERGSFPVAEKLAGILSGEARQLIGQMKLQSDSDIKTGQTSLKIPFGWIPSADEAEKICGENTSAYRKALEKGNREDAKIRKAFLLWAEDLRNRALKRTLPDSLECELQAIRIGEAVFLAFPFELFSSLSLELRRLSGIECLFLVGYANGYHGYLADDESVREGGYEIKDAFKYTALLPFSDQAGNIFLERSLALLQKMA